MHTSPTFCVQKATGEWRIVHAFNKLKAATVLAQTPIPRKDVIIDGMARSTIFSSMDLMEGFYQILMREREIPYTAVSTPSGMLWEWLVMSQEMSNAPATFNRCVTNLLRSVREFAPSYFYDVFVHSRAMDGRTDLEVTDFTSERFLNLCASISCTPTSRSVYLLLTKYHFLVASWASMASGPIQKRSRRSPTGRCLHMSRDFKISLA